MDKYYSKVPQAQREEFFHFRETHPPKSAQIGGVRWEYLVAGDETASPLVLLPGALGTADSAWRTMSKLEQNGKYRLLCPNYPPEINTMSGLADGVNEILDNEGIRSVYLVGGSYGGMLAQVFVHRHPQVVRKLVLSHTYPPTPSRAKGVEPALRLFKVLPIFMVKRMLRQRMTGILPTRPTPELLLISAQIHEAVDTKLTRQAALNTFSRMMDFDQNPFTPTDLAGWEGKTLIMLAEDDPTTPPAMRNLLVELYPGASLHLFKGSGHATSILESEEYIRVMEDFLSQD